MHTTNLIPATLAHAEISPARSWSFEVPTPRFAFAVKTRWLQLHVHSDEGMPLLTVGLDRTAGHAWLTIGFLCIDLGWVWASEPEMLGW